MMNREINFEELEITYKKLILERLDFHTKMRFSRDIVLRVFQTQDGSMMDQIAISIVNSVMGRRKTDIVDFTYQVPENWWESFKESHFKEWLIKKFPVKYKSITIGKKVDFVAVFPEVEVDCGYREIVYIDKIHE